MNKTLEGIGTRMVKFFGRGGYRRLDYEKLSDAIWLDMVRPEIMEKVPDIEYNAFCDILCKMDRMHSVLGDGLSVATMFNLKKEFYRMMSERGWAVPVATLAQ